MNKWNIPDWLEKEVKNRDRHCIYCHSELGEFEEIGKSKGTWEHIINDAKIINRDNIARCCVSCNASKGSKNLSDWLNSDYCKKKGITKDSVAEVVRNALLPKE